MWGSGAKADAVLARNATIVAYISKAQFARLHTTKATDMYTALFLNRTFVDGFGGAQFAPLTSCLLPVGRSERYRTGFDIFQQYGIMVG